MDTSCIPGLVRCPSIPIADNPPYTGSNAVSRLVLFLQLIMPEFQGKSQRLSRTSELSPTSPANFNDAGNVFCANALLKQPDSPVPRLIDRADFDTIDSEPRLSLEKKSSIPGFCRFDFLYLLM